MRDVLYLAWRYLAYQKITTAVLVAAVALIIYLPWGLQLLVSRSQASLTARAAATPLLAGAKGSPLELALRSLYFDSDRPPSMAYGELDRIADELQALDAPPDAGAIPLHLLYRTRHSPIVGTTAHYFRFRGLRVERGRPLALLGQCVLGHQAARREKVAPGGSVVSLPETVFDVDGAYPLKMRVVGVLAPTGTPDDEAVFVDLQTAWVIQGLGHGHQPLANEAQGEGRGQESANRSLLDYNEVTPENVDTFHFHGDMTDFPISSAIVVPGDEQTRTMLQGQYLADDEQVQVIEPEQVIGNLLATVLRVRTYLLLALAVLAAVTLATMTLVFALSIQLRRRELETMHKIGGSRRRIVALLAAEVAGVLAAGAAAAALLAAGTAALSGQAARLLISM